MSVDTTHECPAPYCEERVPFERFACRTHWGQIPQELQLRLISEWRRHPGEESYFEARADALRALGVPDAEVAGLNGGVT